MYTLGIHGGINTAQNFRLTTPVNWLHDAAAVLCRDGQIVAAAEEERFVRIKHTTHFPLESIRHCLAMVRIGIDDVDRIAFTSEHMNQFVGMTNSWQFGTADWLQPRGFRAVAAGILREELGASASVTDKISCAGHHMSHALSAVRLCGWDDALCVVLDGWGDNLTGLIMSMRGGKLEVLRKVERLGPAALYLMGTELVGYAQFDEYKVMGLAPYGDPSVFLPKFEEHARLAADGDFDLRFDQAARAAFAGAHRVPGSAFEQRHKDFSAALQVMTERILMHVLTHFAKVTGHKRLCLAGGVAQNCTANGKILGSGLFDDVFVQPVAYDAGCAIGAALHAYEAGGGTPPSTRMTHLYYGTDVPAQVGALLDTWKHVVTVTPLADASTAAAKLIADGKVIAWVQGRAEFGARALGDRSILADPRPAVNKDRINAMVKKREGYRPFAPSVAESDLHEYFDVPAQLTSLPFMVFVVKVKEKHRSLLGAITHVDGTARVQTVSKASNERYWRLIEEVRRLTGVPMVLNTSFNNNAEPIVDTPEDALNCFLSTNLDALVIGDFLVEKKAGMTQVDVLASLRPLASHRYALVRQAGIDGRLGHQLYDRHKGRYGAISAGAAACLEEAVDGGQAFGEVLDWRAPEVRADLAVELNALWERRVFTLTAPKRA